MLQILKILRIIIIVEFQRCNYTRFTSRMIVCTWEANCTTFAVIEVPFYFIANYNRIASRDRTTIQTLFLKGTLKAYDFVFIVK